MSHLLPYFHDITKKYLKNIRDQQTMELKYKKTKDNPDPKTMTLDLSTAPACFEKMKVILSAMWGATGIPLHCVILTDLRPPAHGSDQAWSMLSSRYMTIDTKLIAWDPILGDRANLHHQDSILELKGPFHATFSTDMKKVWALLYATFGHNSCWQHVNKFQTTQNGCRALSIIFK